MADLLLEAAMDLDAVDVDRFEVDRFGDLRLQKKRRLPCGLILACYNYDLEEIEASARPVPVIRLDKAINNLDVVAETRRQWATEKRRQIVVGNETEPMSVPAHRTRRTHFKINAAGAALTCSGTRRERTFPIMFGRWRRQRH